MMDRVYHLHLVSDATGETLNTVAKAVGAQFDGIEAREHTYPLVRNKRQLSHAMKQIRARPGVVFFTLVNPALRKVLERECALHAMPCVSVLDQPAELLRDFLGVKESHRPGGQHEIDGRYFERMEAVNYAIQHDDGQNHQQLSDADVILVGPSRTSKTPTCVYLAIRGVRAANIPFILGTNLLDHLFTLKKPLIIGLWTSPERLLQVRRNRLSTLGETRDTNYTNEDAVRAELAAARKLYERYDWPAIDVSRRSIEETAATILNLLSEREPDEESD